MFLNMVNHLSYRVNVEAECLNDVLTLIMNKGELTHQDSLRLRHMGLLTNEDIEALKAEKGAIFLINLLFNKYLEDKKIEENLQDFNAFRSGAEAMVKGLVQLAERISIKKRV